MKPITSNQASQTNIEWFCLKLSWIFVSLPITSIMAYEGSGCPFPTGVCKFYNFAPLFTPLGRPLLVATFVVLCLIYLFEIKMLFISFLLFLLSCIIVSHHESNGIFYRATILSTVWGAQFFAYLRWQFNRQFNLQQFRIQYVIQIIAATYTLAAIAKLRASGIDWITGGNRFPVHVIKNYAYLYFDTGSKTILQQGEAIADFLLRHPEIVQSFLAVSLMLELFCLAAAFGGKMRWIFGIGLVLMHIGIAYIMGIGISVIAKPMIIFFLNPLYLAVRLTDYLRNKSKVFFLCFLLAIPLTVLFNLL